MGLSPGKTPRENRPEGAAKCRALFPEITFVENDSMAFQKLTKLFLIRRRCAQSGGKGTVAIDGPAFQPELGLSIFKTNAADQITKEFHVVWDLTPFHIRSNHIAKQPPEVLVAWVRHKTSGVR